MDICIESHLFGDDIFPGFSKSPFIQIPSAFHGSHSLTLLLSFSPLRKTEGENQHEAEVLPRLKIRVHSEKHSFLKDKTFQTIFQQQRQGYLQQVKYCWCHQSLCLHQFHCWRCDCFTLASLGSNPDNFKIWKCTN